MKNTVKFWFAFNNITQHFKKFLLSIVMLAVSLCLISIVFLLYKNEDYTANIADHILARGLANTGNIYFDPFAAMGVDLAQMELDIYNSDKIDSVGSIDANGVFSPDNLEIFSDLHEIQFSGWNEDNQHMEHGYVTVIWMRPTLFRLCGLKLDEGDFLTEEQLMDDNAYIYLGSNFKGKIEVGKVYEDNGYKYIVAGIFRKGSLFLEANIDNNLSYPDLRMALDLENQVILTCASGGPIYFSTAEGTSFDEAREEIRNITNKYQVDAVIQSLSEIYGAGVQEKSIMISYITRIFIIVCFSAVLIISCLQIVAILNERKAYGILYSIGASPRDIYAIIFWENLLKLIISFLMSAAGVIWISSQMFDRMLKVAMKEIVLVSVLPKVFFGSVIILTIASILPVIVIRKMTPSKLMRR